MFFIPILNDFFPPSIWFDLLIFFPSPVPTYLHVIFVTDAAFLGGALGDGLGCISRLFVSQELLEPFVQLWVFAATGVNTSNNY